MAKNRAVTVISGTSVTGTVGIQDNVLIESDLGSGGYNLIKQNQPVGESGDVCPKSETVYGKLFPGRQYSDFK